MSQDSEKIQYSNWIDNFVKDKEIKSVKVPTNQHKIVQEPFKFYIFHAFIYYLEHNYCSNESESVFDVRTFHWAFKTCWKHSYNSNWELIQSSLDISPSIFEYIKWEETVKSWVSPSLHEEAGLPAPNGRLMSIVSITRIDWPLSSCSRPPAGPSPL